MVQDKCASRRKEVIACKMGADLTVNAVVFEISLNVIDVARRDVQYRDVVEALLVHLRLNPLNI